MTLSFAPERIEQWPLERLKPYARNAKTHGADQVAKIAGSIAQFGWTVPVLVADDGDRSEIGSQSPFHRSRMKQKMSIAR